MSIARSRRANGSTPRTAVLLAVCTLLVGCADRGPLPPVFGAVFGFEGAEAIPYTSGRIPEPAVEPGSRLVGAAAATPGSCIWQTPERRRFRAACPEGSDGLAPRS